MTAKAKRQARPSTRPTRSRSALAAHKPGARAAIDDPTADPTAIFHLDGACPNADCRTEVQLQVPMPTYLRAAAIEMRAASQSTRGRTQRVTLLLCPLCGTPLMMRSDRAKIVRPERAG
jgi:hypothetical protein